MNSPRPTTEMLAPGVGSRQARRPFCPCPVSLPGGVHPTLRFHGRKRVPPWPPDPRSMTVEPLSLARAVSRMAGQWAGAVMGKPPPYHIVRAERSGWPSKEEVL